MTAQDTLRLTRGQYEAWHADRSYDYDSQFVTSGRSLLSAVGEWLNKLMTGVFGSETYTEYRTLIWCTIAVVLLLVIAAFLWYKHPALFMRDKTGGKLEYDVTEDNIYGVDFDSEISKALDRGDYREAVRLCYLKTLRWLSDTGRIDWQPFKTPLQYSAEFSDSNFRSLTVLFQRVRYGGFAADRQTYERVSILHGLITAADKVFADAADSPAASANNGKEAGE